MVQKDYMIAKNHKIYINVSYVNPCPNIITLTMARFIKWMTIIISFAVVIYTWGERLACLHHFLAIIITTLLITSSIYVLGTTL